jgi:hypothetical protein
MTDTPGAFPTTPPEQPPRKASSWRVVLMLVIGGPILAAGGCALFLSDFRLEGGGGGNDNLSALGAIIFIAGCIAFLVGVVWAIARWLLRLSDKAQPKPAP